MLEAVAGEAVCMPIIELGDFAGVATGPRYCVIVSRRRGSYEFFKFAKLEGDNIILCRTL